jgi:hypothetical protein
VFHRDGTCHHKRIVYAYLPIIHSGMIAAGTHIISGKPCFTQLQFALFSVQLSAGIRGCDRFGTGNQPRTYHAHIEPVFLE